MGNFLVKSGQQNELKKLKMAMLNFRTEIKKLSVGYTGKVFSEDEGLIKQLVQIDVKIEQTLKMMNGLRKGILVGYAPAGKGRSSIFESELGRVGQMRGELVLLQQQLIQLKEEVSGLLSKLFEGLHDPMKTGQKTLEHIKELSKIKMEYENLQQVPGSHDTIHLPNAPTPGLDGAMISLTALLFFFLANWKQKQQL